MDLDRVELRHEAQTHNKCQLLIRLLFFYGHCRLPREAITVIEDPESFVMPICLPKTSRQIFQDASEHLVISQFEGKMLPRKTLKF